MDAEGRCQQSLIVPGAGWLLEEQQHKNEAHGDAGDKFLQAPAVQKGLRLLWMPLGEEVKKMA